MIRSDPIRSDPIQSNPILYHLSTPTLYQTDRGLFSNRMRHINTNADHPPHHLSFCHHQFDHHLKMLFLSVIKNFGRCKYHHPLLMSFPPHHGMETKTKKKGPAFSPSGDFGATIEGLCRQRQVAKRYSSITFWELNLFHHC